MIASFENFYTADCAKCDRRIDGQAMFPVARRPKPSLVSQTELVNEWVALHEECLP